MGSTIYIIAGEESGDVYGAKLITEISRNKSNIQFKGIGGPRMISAGLVNSIVPMQDISVIGFWEVIKKILFFKKIQRAVENEIFDSNPSIIILIDYPGFNLSLIKRISGKVRSKIVYYVAPQAWAWKEKRVRILRDCVDSLICLFPFEVDWFRDRGVEASYFGHPIASQAYHISKKGLKKELGLDPSMTLITLFPGSRNQEYAKHFSLMEQAALKIKSSNNKIQIAVGVASGISVASKSNREIHFERQDPQKLLQASDIAIIASGTATIEAAVYQTPMIVIYRLSFFSWLLSTALIRTKYISMVNIILGRMLVPELIQTKASVKNIVESTESLINDSAYRDIMLNGFDEIKNMLASRDPIKDAAEHITNKYAI